MIYLCILCINNISSRTFNWGQDSSAGVCNVIVTQEGLLLGQWLCPALNQWLQLYLCTSHSSNCRSAQPPQLLPKTFSDWTRVNICKYPVKQWNIMKQDIIRDSPRNSTALWPGGPPAELDWLYKIKITLSDIQIPRKQWNKIRWMSILSI